MKLPYIIRKLLNGKINFSLLLKTPKNYLYSFTIPKDEKVKLESYNPKAAEIANQIINIVQNIDKTLITHFIGSASLGIRGQNDIDIFVESPTNLFEKYIPLFDKDFSSPQKIKTEFILWNFNQCGYDIELVLIDPKSHKFIDQMKGYNAIKNDPNLRQEYINLKNSLANSSLQEYTQKKMEFFNKAIGL